MWDIFFCTLRLICEMMKLLCSCVVVVVVYFSFSLCIIKHILWASEFWSEKRVLCCSMCIILCAFCLLMQHIKGAESEHIQIRWSFNISLVATVSHWSSFIRFLRHCESFPFFLFFDAVYLSISILRVSVWLLNEWATENRTRKKNNQEGHINPETTVGAQPLTKKKWSEKKRQPNNSATYISNGMSFGLIACRWGDGEQMKLKNPKQTKKQWITTWRSSLSESVSRMNISWNLVDG